MDRSISVGSCRSDSYARSGTGSPRELTHKLQVERRANDSLRDQLNDAIRELNVLTESRAIPQGQHVPEQARLLREAQTVVKELRDDMVTLQAENAELRRQTNESEAIEELRTLRPAHEAAVERHKREVKESRFKLLRTQQEKQKLKQQVSDLEVELASRPKSLEMEESAAEKIKLLETANDELRKDNAALREQKLTFMTGELNRWHKNEKPEPAEVENERLTKALDQTVADLAAARGEIDKYQSIAASQESLLERRAQEYEALLECRRGEQETVAILNDSLRETQEAYDQAQEEISKLHRAHRELHNELTRVNNRRDREAREGSLQSESNAGKVEELTEELSVVKKTATNAISTLSTSLKKALNQIKELCDNFEHDRLEMKEENESARARVAELEAVAGDAQREVVLLRDELQRAGDELREYKRQADESRTRAHEAKQRMRAEIDNTKELIRAQQEIDPPKHDSVSTPSRLLDRLAVGDAAGSQ